MEEEEEEGGEGSSSWRETIARRGEGGRGRSRLSLLLTFHAFYTVVSSVVFDKRELKIKGVSIGKDASHGAYDNSFS